MHRWPSVRPLAEPRGFGESRYQPEPGAPVLELNPFKVLGISANSPPGAITNAY